MSHEHLLWQQPTAASALSAGSALQVVTMMMSAGFLVGGLFYLYRLLFARPEKAVNGAWDIENEIGHALCMFGMVTMLTPSWFPLPSGLWVMVLGLGAAWFMARTVSWGLKRPGNKWWWDLTHVGMLGFMALMYAEVSFPLVNFAAAVFWIYFFVYAGYYSYDLRRSGYQPNWLEVGSDLAHITMGIAMFVMTVWPDRFMVQ
jgi:hypothetical protein